VPDKNNPKKTFPFISLNDGRRFFIVPIYPKYHTELLPDSILNTESPKEFIENSPHRNAIQKVYISRSLERDLRPSDVIVFYRTTEKGRPAHYTSVVSTIGIVENKIDNISNAIEFINLCRKRSVFSDKELKTNWDYIPKNRPFIVNFLYLYSLPKRLNLKTLIELGVIAKAPRGFEQISLSQFQTILRGSKTDESFIIN
jgi:hypothetical protein